MGPSRGIVALLLVASCGGVARDASSRNGSPRGPTETPPAARCRLVGETSGLAGSASEFSLAITDADAVLDLGDRRVALVVDDGLAARDLATESTRSVAFALDGRVHTADLDGDHVAIDGESSEESPSLGSWNRAPIVPASGRRFAVLPFQDAGPSYSPLVVHAPGSATAFVVGGPNRGPMVAATSTRGVALAYPVDAALRVLRLRGDESLHVDGEWTVPAPRELADTQVAFVGPRILIGSIDVAMRVASLAVVVPGTSIEPRHIERAPDSVGALAIGSDEGRPVIALSRSASPRAEEHVLEVATLADSLDALEPETLRIPIPDRVGRIRIAIAGSKVVVATLVDGEPRFRAFALDCDLALPARLVADLPEPPRPTIHTDTDLEPDCASPADCADRRACVVNALGGPLGCTGESCCGASECINGCLSDSDCPACRPDCIGADDGTAGHCVNPNGP